MRLIGTVCPAKPLNSNVGPPPRLNEVVLALFLVLGRSVGVKAPAGPARLGKNKDVLFPIHEGPGISLGFCGAPCLLNLFARLLVPDDPESSARDLGHPLVAKRIEDELQGAARRIDRGKPHLKVFLHRQSFLIDNFIPVGIKNGFHSCIPILVLDFLVLVDRKRLVNEAKQFVHGAHVDLFKILPLFNPGQGSFLKGLPGVDEL